MSIAELINAIGVENIQVQFLYECMTNVQSTKHGSKVTFATTALSPGTVASNSGPVGVVLWVPRDTWNKVTKV